MWIQHTFCPSTQLINRHTPVCSLIQPYTPPPPCVYTFTVTSIHPYTSGLRDKKLRSPVQTFLSTYFVVWIGYPILWLLEEFRVLDHLVSFSLSLVLSLVLSLILSFILSLALSVSLSLALSVSLSVSLSLSLSLSLPLSPFFFLSHPAALFTEVPKHTHTLYLSPSLPSFLSRSGLFALSRSRVLAQGIFLSFFFAFSPAPSPVTLLPSFSPPPSTTLCVFGSISQALVFVFSPSLWAVSFAIASSRSLVSELSLAYTHKFSLSRSRSALVNARERSRAIESKSEHILTCTHTQTHVHSPSVTFSFFVSFLFSLPL